MFEFLNLLLVFAPLLTLMLSVAGGHFGFLVQGGEWVEYPYVKECLLKSSPQKPLAVMSSLELSCFGTSCGEYLARQGL